MLSEYCVMFNEEKLFQSIEIITMCLRSLCGRTLIYAKIGSPPIKDMRMRSEAEKKKKAMEMVGWSECLFVE